MTAARAFLLVLFTLIVPTGGRAQALEVCNELPYAMWFSLGFEHQEEVLTLGWNRLDAAACGSVDDWVLGEGYSMDALGGRFWLHAVDDYLSPNEAYGDGEDLCVDRVFERYLALFADSTCEKRGYDIASHTVLQTVLQPAAAASQDAQETQVTSGGMRLTLTATGFEIKPSAAE